MKKYTLIISLVAVLVGIGWYLGWGKKTDTIVPPKVVTPTQDEQNQKAEDLLAGMYTGKFEKNNTDMVASLVLSADKTATLTITPTRIEKGDWKLGEANRIEVTLAQTSEQRSAEPKTLIFKYDTTAGTLELKDYDKDTWGKDGLDLTKTLDLTGTTWTWLETTLSDETEVQADDKQSFSLTFREKNKLELTTDCNKVQASYKTNGIDEMKVMLGAMTQMACEGSHEGEFLKQLGSAESFLLEGSSLRLTLKDEAGTMTFTRK